MLLEVSFGAVSVCSVDFRTHLNLRQKAQSAITFSSINFSHCAQTCLELDFIFHLIKLREVSPHGVKQCDYGNHLQMKDLERHLCHPVAVLAASDLNGLRSFLTVETFKSYMRRAGIKNIA